jgi:hypothetical protein
MPIFSFTDVNIFWESKPIPPFGHHFERLGQHGACSAAGQVQTGKGGGHFRHVKIAIDMSSWVGGLKDKTKS